MPKNPKLTRRPTVFAPKKVRLRKKVRSSIGLRVRSSTTVNAVKVRPATTKRLMMGTDPHPYVLDSMNANVSDPKPTMARSWPGMSRPRPSGFFDSRTTRAVKTRAMIPMGTFR